MREKNLRALIALTLIPGLGNRKIQALIEFFKQPDIVFKQSKRSLQRVEGIGEASSLGVLSFKNWTEVDAILKRTQSLDAQLMVYSDEDYPPNLKQIYDPPLVLWLKGNRNVLSSKSIAIVGTRSPSSYGKDTARFLTKALIGQRLTVVSGLAYGIDTIAHQISVEEAGLTVGVLGSGIDVIYPWKNQRLVRQIIDTGGALITEFPPGTNPDAGNFPVRNRIVSGLSSGVLVIESGVQGGSLITAELALDQSKEVFAVPHSIQSTKGNGCNYLIKTGQAKLVQSAHDILEELPMHTNSKQSGSSNKYSWKDLELDASHKKVCSLLDDSDMSIEELSDHLKIDSRSLLIELLTMEMQGIVHQKAGKVFSINERLKCL